MDSINSYNVKIINVDNSLTNLSFINTAVEKVYVINLINNTIRRNYINVLMNKFGINFTFIIVDKINEKINKIINNKNIITKAELGCLLSHLWCLNDIKKNKYKNAIIFEDDIIFHKDFINLFKNVFSIKHDFLLLGACDFSFASIHQFNVHNNLYVINENAKKVYGAHANYYSYKAASEMLDMHINNNNNNNESQLYFFDKNYSKMFQIFKNSAFICYPNLVVSDISTTNLHHYYPFFSIAENNYFHKCFVDFKFSDYRYICLSLLDKKYPIEKKDTFESYINKILYFHFFNQDKINKIKNRLEMSFFTINDLKMMMNI
jgi:GR25 family glycosyltransferase involved in LPS biosynthesis